MSPAWRKRANSANIARSAHDDDYRTSQPSADPLSAHRSVPIPRPTRPHNISNTLHALREHRLLLLLFYFTSAFIFTYLSFLYRQHNPYTSYTSLLCHFSVFYRKYTTDTRIAVVLDSFRIVFTREVRNWIGHRLRKPRHRLLLLIAYGTPECLRLSVQLLCRFQFVSSWLFFGYRPSRTGSIWWHIFWLTYASLEISINTLDYLVLRERQRQKNGEAATIFADYVNKWENFWWWRGGVGLFLESANGVQNDDNDDDDDHGGDDGDYGNNEVHHEDVGYEFLDHFDASSGPEYNLDHEHYSEHENNNPVGMVDPAPFLTNGVALGKNDGDDNNNNNNNNNNSIFSTVVENILNPPATPKPPTLRSTHALLRRRDIYRPLFYILCASLSTHSYFLPPTFYPWSTHSFPMSTFSGLTALLSSFYLGQWIVSRLNFPQRRAFYLILTTAFSLIYIPVLVFKIVRIYSLTARFPLDLLSFLFQAPNEELNWWRLYLKLPFWTLMLGPAVAEAFCWSLADYQDMVEAKRRSEMEGRRPRWKRVEFAVWEGDDWGWWEEEWE